ncbi:MAG: aspartate aminotransferase family protein [Nitrososphaerota archaeon]|nr:aspartate aminotransferase family protein [Candidatus Bathyarchaeota archaeon]MCX8162638.1 aspartate aminotransferase family protein [Candidatus Bathyarchaeota archaeon]MDW8062364.1 aspartate aminotransferase family protein [Nitrososphaerota archaeon]
MDGHALHPSRVIEVEDSILASTYSKIPIVAVKGRGARIWDIDGREYVDCMGGYGVALVGHCHPKVVEAIRMQAEKLIVCHGSIYNDARAEFIEKLISIAPKGLDKVFLSNSGAEAVEAALKIARKYTGRKAFISMMGGYHGKTMGALSVTWREDYRHPFEPLIGEVRFTPYGDIDRLRSLATGDVAAVIVEPVQGESGVKIPPDDYLKEVRELCDEKGILLILDEIQCGLCRTGKMWASQHWGVTPDILCVAKGLASGIPIGATIAPRDIMDKLSVGEHTSTFGGNPIACAAGSATIDILISEKLAERAWEVGSLFKRMLEDRLSKYRVVREVRGLGLMIAFDLRLPVKDVVLGAAANGLLILYSGRTTVRLLPPLVIGREEVERAVSILEKLIAIEDEKLKSRIHPS